MKNPKGVGATAWPHLLADLTAKRDALTEIIDKLTTLFVRDDITVGEVIARRVPVPRRKTTEVRRSVKTATPRRAARADRNETRRDDERRATILTLLQTGPLATREIATRLHLDRILTKMTLQRMKKVGLVTSTGVTNGQRWASSTGSGTDAEVATVSPPAAKTHHFGTTKELAVVDNRDQAILRYLRLHDGVAAAEQLKAAMPKEPTLTNDQADTAFRSALLRLKAKGAIDRTGTTWSLVGAGSRAEQHG